MNASSGENLSAVRTTHMNAGAHGLRIMRRTRHGHARFLRTNVTCIWGVSDPLPTAPGPNTGGGGKGVAHAPDAAISNFTTLNRAALGTTASRTEPQRRTRVTPLTLGSRNDIRGALKAIDDLLHAIEHHFLKTNPTNYDFLDNIGGVDSLLDIIDRGLKSRDEQFGYFRSSHPRDPS